MISYGCPNCGNMMNDTEEKCRYCGTINPNYSSVPKKIKNVVPEEKPKEKLESSPSPVSPVYSNKSRGVCGLLQLIFGFGLGRFYSGHTRIAVAQLLITLFGLCMFYSGFSDITTVSAVAKLTLGVLTFFPAKMWTFIDGIIILSNRNFKDSTGKVMK